jgi:membrane protease YdiL (CAAX protease family)
MNWRRSALTAIVFVLAATQFFWLAIDTPGIWPFSLPTRWADSAIGLTKVVLWVLPSLLILMVAGRHGPAAGVRRLGLSHGLPQGYAFGLAATLPMALVIPFGGWPHPRADVLIDTLFLGPFAEEILFRGFLLTWLLHAARWRPSAAILTSALMFGLAHEPNLAGDIAAVIVRPLAGLPPIVSPLASTFVVAMRFGVGGVLFGWVYYRWGSLWPSIALHSSINLWWDLSIGQPGPTTYPALSGALPAAHGLAVLLAIGLTLRWARASDTNKDRPPAVSEVTSVAGPS